QRSGFGIGNHTWSHPQLTRLSDAAVKGQLRRTRGAMKRHGITPTTLMRPPYGDIDARVRKDVGSLGLSPVLWTIDSGDWEGGNARQISDRILSALRPHRTNIVLQHDGVTNSPSSVAAVPRVVKEARKRGYCFAGLGKHGGVARPVPQVRATVTRGHEQGPKAVRVRLDLDRPTSHPVSLRVETVSGTASAGEDFRARTLNVVLATGVRHAWFTVPVRADDVAEPTETFRLVLSKPRGVTFRQASYGATILDAGVPVRQR
ncbi:MAG: polysaccharide deacetylase, partial [Marmoricola sp.]|nr:polysaccharide deacetylase [Marmoricola sp.]